LVWLAYLCDAPGAWITASLYERRGGMFLLNVKMISSSILEMQRCEWPETLQVYLERCPVRLLRGKPLACSQEREIERKCMCFFLIYNQGLRPLVAFAQLKEDAE
jgi:hypothetical protein